MSEALKILGMPAIVDRATWQQEREHLLAREKAHTRVGDAIAAARRRLPMTEVPATVLRGEAGDISLVDVFERRRQLLAYGFMWQDGKPFEEQCEGCTFAIAHAPPRDYLHERDVTFAAFCQGPWEEIAAYRDFMGWTMPWYSTHGVREVEGVGGEKFLRAYLRDGEKVYQTYETTDRGIEVLVNALGLLDRTVFGRQETWEDSPTDWPQLDAASEWWRRDGRPIAQWARTAQPATGAHEHHCG
jgi:predicted dithiol-disulfide oxidoreductase (DUF899 family)